MFNYWYVSSPRKKINSIPNILAEFTESMMRDIWLEHRGYDDRTLKDVIYAGGGKKYFNLLINLGLIFIRERNFARLNLTLAGKAILNGESLVKVLTNQILKYQFPSSFSISRGVNVNKRFKIHPFWFLLKILCDSRINYLTQEEIFKIIITEAENDSDKCYEKIISRLIEFRNFGDSCLDKNFAQKYTSSKGTINFEKPFDHLDAIANTIINWLEYTQFISREDGKIFILKEKFDEVKKIIENPIPFIKRPE